jgi:tetratricopeptide (TPR) repeat protein
MCLRSFFFCIAHGVMSLLLVPYTIASPGSQNSSFDALAHQAAAARDADRLADAVTLYRRALTIRPAWAEGWWSLATLEYDQDHYAKAAYSFRKVIALQPNNGTAEAMLGLCEFELGHEELALRHIESGRKLGLQKNPELQTVVLYHQGLLLQRKESFQAAQDTLEELCLETGPNDQAASVLGMTMLRLTSASLPEPDSPNAAIVLRVGRAECLAGQKKYDDANRAFQEIARVNPNYPNIHYAFGLFLLETRNVPDAVEQFKQEIQNRPDDVIPRLRIAAAEYKEDSGAGIPYAEEAVKLAPQQPFAHYLLGLLRLDLDKYQEAIPELELAEKGLPHEPKLYAALASAYSRAGRKQEAAKARATFARLNEQAKKSAQDTQATDRSGEAKNPISGSVSVPE